MGHQCVVWRHSWIEAKPPGRRVALCLSGVTLGDAQGTMQCHKGNPGLLQAKVSVLQPSKTLSGPLGRELDGRGGLRWFQSASRT